MDTKLFFERMKLERSITPPKEDNPLLQKWLNDYRIDRYRVSEYTPRDDCLKCTAHYKLAQKLNRKKEKIILLVKFRGIDSTGDIIGLEVV